MRAADMAPSSKAARWKGCGLPQPLRRGQEHEGQRKDDTNRVVRDPAYSALSRLLRRCGNAAVAKDTLRHVAQPTTHKAVVGRRDVEGAFEEDGAHVHDDGRPESHGNGDQDMDELDVHKPQRVSLCPTLPVTGAAIRTPSSVRSRCPLYRMRFCLFSNAWLDRTA